MPLPDAEKNRTFGKQTTANSNYLRFMQSTTNPWEHILGILWLIMGLFLMLAFFLPNYTTPVMDIDGLDLLKTATNDPRAFSRMTRDLHTFFMVLAPFTYVLLGLLAIIAGAISINGRKSSMELLVTIWAGLSALIGLLTVFLLLNRNDAPSFFMKFLPKPGVVFYLTVLAAGLILVSGIMRRSLNKPEST